MILRQDRRGATFWLPMQRNTALAVAVIALAAALAAWALQPARTSSHLAGRVLYESGPDGARACWVDRQARLDTSGLVPVDGAPVSPAAVEMRCTAWR